MLYNLQHANCSPAAARALVPRARKTTNNATIAHSASVRALLEEPEEQLDVVRTVVESAASEWARAVGDSTLGFANAGNFISLL